MEWKGEEGVESLRNFDWELSGMLAMFFGPASVIVSFLEPLLTDRPFEPILLVFGIGCLIFFWVALEVTVQIRGGS